MPLRIVDHPVVLMPFLLLAVSLLTGEKVSWILMGLSLWLIVYISFTGEAKIEGQKIVIRIGRPIPLAKKEILLDEVVEVIELPGAYGIRMIGQFQRPWVPIGCLTTGLFVGILLLLRGESYGIFWMYISLLSSLDYLFRPVDKRIRVVASGIISLFSALAFFYLRHPEFSLGVIAYGFFDVISSEDYGQDAIIIKTENEKIVLLGESASKERFLKGLRSIIVGGLNAQTP
ncbi:hypothetical protein [Thermococcus pacificus]|uniref:Uncharacterized protein n=1 Tax=Thermococcus pacificus TaxID=71998 RepID=A0A218P6P0_9EURY|nr:hypothetical protein [Thermococcus pacificus]ASJ06455.1 hypothetical protein A3L08_03475 [Thermococcus pacificus]